MNDGNERNTMVGKQRKSSFILVVTTTMSLLTHTVVSVCVCVGEYFRSPEGLTNIREKNNILRLKL